MITHLAVKNYRSLKDVSLSLGPLVVLIGANGSGKSNILDVLRLIRDLTASSGMTTNKAFEERGGYKEVVWGGQISQEIEIKIEWQDNSSNDAGVNTYLACFGHTERYDVAFLKEEYQHSQGLVMRRAPPDTSLTELTQDSVSRSRHHTRITESAMPELRTQWENLQFHDLSRLMGEWAFYRFNPSQMRPVQPVRKQYRLVESGQNLSTVIHTLFSEGDPILDEIVDVLKACVPTVEELRSPITHDGLTYVALKERSVPAAVGSWGLSDGTLLALALATALLTPRPPSLLALETPDIELHPYVMETLAEMLKLASKKAQVIVTTHSPYLLEFLPPDSFVVVEKTEGATRCSPVKGRRGLQKVIKELGARNAWYAGHIGGVP